MTTGSVIVDAHQHVWDLGRASYPWLGAELAPIDRTIELDEALPTMLELGVDATILVQAADSAEDTANMVRVADAHPQVVGIVAWVPLDEPEKAGERLTELKRDARVVGVRTLLHARPDPDWVLRDDVATGLGLVSDAGLTFDFVTGGPAALAQVPQLSARSPELAIVIDHLGKPPIGGPKSDRLGWRRLIAAAAENPKVSAKLSGLYASSGALDGWTVEGIRPFVEDALEIFGPERLMFGGDWPISVLAGGYCRTWGAVTDVLADLDPESRAAILGGTAAAVYSLDPELLAVVGAARKETK